MSWALCLLLVGLVKHCCGCHSEDTNPLPHLKDWQLIRVTDRRVFKGGMVIRPGFKASTDIGGYCKLTNTFCLVGTTPKNGKIVELIEDLLEGHIPVVRASINQSPVIASMIAANSRGVLLPWITTDAEYMRIRNGLPDQFVVYRCPEEERFTSLGSLILLNDHVAIMHPEISEATAAVVAQRLGVRVFRKEISTRISLPLASHCLLNNVACMVHTEVTEEELKLLRSFLRVPCTKGSVHRGSREVAQYALANDWVVVCTSHTTRFEMAVLQHIFKFKYSAHMD